MIFKGQFLGINGTVLLKKKCDQHLTIKIAHKRFLALVKAVKIGA